MEDYVPWMRSILDRMKELYNKPNAQTIAEALPELGGGGGGSGTDSNAVHYTQDSGKTEAEKQQARDNIDAAASSDIPDVSGLEPKKLVVTITESGGVFSADKTFAEIDAARNAGKIILVYCPSNDYYCLLTKSDGAEFVFSSAFTESGKDYLVQFSLIQDRNTDVWEFTRIMLEQSPITIICTMTSSEGGTWTGATFAELQAACAAGRVLNANVVGVANVTGFMQDGDSGTSIITSPISFPSSQYGVVTFLSDGTFFFRWFVTPDPTVVRSNPASASITLDSAADNTIYEYGELTALTISSIPSFGAFIITFTSGATPTVLTVPNTMIMPDRFTVEANTSYEINVRDGYALCAGWAVGA